MTLSSEDCWRIEPHNGTIKRVDRLVAGARPMILAVPCRPTPEARGVVISGLSSASRSCVIPAAGVKAGDMEQGFENSAAARAPLPDDAFKEAQALQEP